MPLEGWPDEFGLVGFSGTPEGGEEPTINVECLQVITPALYDLGPNADIMENSQSMYQSKLGDNSDDRAMSPGQRSVQTKKTHNFDNVGTPLNGCASNLSYMSEQRSTRGIAARKGKK
jgi:hypothetical protein